MNLDLRHKIILEIIISIFLVVCYSVLYFYADALIEYPLFAALDPRLFPKTIILAVIVFSLLLVLDSVSMWRKYQAGKITHHMRTLVSDAEEEYPMGRVFVYIGTLFLYLLSFYYIGFVYSTPIIMLIVAYLLGMRNIFVGAVCFVLFTLALDYASLHFLQILLPSGALFQ